MKKKLISIALYLVGMSSCSTEPSNDPSNCSCPDKVEYVSINSSFIIDGPAYDDYHGVYKIDTLAPDKHRLYICQYWDYCRTYEKVVDGTIYSIKKEWGTGASFSK